MQEAIEKIPGASGKIVLHPPEPPRVRRRILPVFMPRAGCSGRCVFCAQELQSGTPQASLGEVLEYLADKLAAARTGPPVELAFYGGSFTALPKDWLNRFMALAGAFRREGVVQAVRCSTRPDAAAPDLLARLREQGLDTVEFGVQTFDAAVLKDAGRGHGPDEVFEACDAARAAGIAIGLQMLPGLPGHTPGAFVRDIGHCLDIRPDMIRLHPCLVLAGTGLEDLWRQGSFLPWNLDETVERLAPAVLALWRAEVSVARIGLAVEPSLDRAVLAGPRHPALGTMVRGRALYLHVAGRLGGGGLASLVAPQRLSGEFWGHGRELEQAWHGLGLRPGAVVFEDREDFILHVTQNR